MPRSLFRTLHARHGKPVDAMTRREMLRVTLAGTTGMLLSNRFGLAAQRPASGARVVVIGAGFAGLAAAYELTAAGYDVTIVEARNRIGGRVLSFKDLVPGKVVEGGGELIGSNHPAWVSYSEKFGLKFLDVTEDEDFDFPVILNGKLLSSEESEALYKEMDAAFEKANADAAPIDADEPWKSPNAERLDRTTVAAWIDGLGVSPLCHRGLHALFTADNGVATGWQSYLANLAQIKGGGLERYWTESEVYRCQGGNQQLATKLAAGFKPDKLILRTPVTAVKMSDRLGLVSLANGKTLEADHVILAVPPPVWNKIGFDPLLPGGLDTQMGANVKYLIALKSRFWRRAETAPDLLADGPVHLTWEATDNQPGPGAALVAFSGGPAADVTREWTATERRGNYLKILERAYKGISAQFVRDRYMNWPSDPWVKGSYTFPAPGQITAAGPQLRKGLGRLHFAGEHTNYAFIGYMEGGLGSGIAAARRIAEADGILKEEAA